MQNRLSILHLPHLQRKKCRVNLIDPLHLKMRFLIIHLAAILGERTAAGGLGITSSRFGDRMSPKIHGRIFRSEAVIPTPPAAVRSSRIAVHLEVQWV